MPRLRRKCVFVKEGGQRCDANAMANGPFCFFHSPDTVAERTAARRAGGLERARKVAVLPPDTPDWSIHSAVDIVGLVSDTANRVRRGELDPRVAGTIGSLCSVMLHALQVGNLEGRLSALERAEEHGNAQTRLGSEPGLAETELE